MAEDIRPDRLKFDPATIGGTGLRQTGGYVSEEFLKELIGAKGAKVYREMADNDPVCGAVLFAISKLIRQCDWTFQAVDDSPEAEEAQKFAEEVLFKDMSVPWSSVLDEVCSMFTYGFAPMEIVWKRRSGLRSTSGRSQFDDGRIGIKALSLRGQETIQKWYIDEVDGSIDGLQQQPWNRSFVDIPIEKLLLFRTSEVKNNPEGRSILRSAYRPYYFKKRIEEIEGVGIERDLAGLPVAMIPSQYMRADADATDKAIYAVWQQMVTRVRRDQQEGIIIPSDRDSSGNPLFEFKLLNAGGARSFNTSEIIDRYDKRIATCVLADFIFLGQQTVGSFALSSDKTALFAMAIGAFTKSICDTINRHLMPRLWQLNGLPFEVMPAMQVGDIERQSLSEIADFVTALAGAGAPLFPDRELENHLRKMAGLPMAAEEGGDIEVGSPDEMEPEEEVEAPEPEPPEEQIEPDEPVEMSKLRVVGGRDVDFVVRKNLIYDDRGVLIAVEERRLAAGDEQ